jgi:hypothetical protein
MYDTAVTGSLFESPPDQSVRELAAIPDERLADDVRSAMIAVGYWFDAWWAATKPHASPIQQQRADKLETARHQFVALGPGATMEQFYEVVHPLLGEFLETRQLRAAVDLVRDVIMHRWPLIKYAREAVSSWDDQYQRGRIG